MQAADALRAAAERTVEVGDAAWPWAFTRAWLLTTRFEWYGRDRRDLIDALAEFATLPDGVPGRARLAAVLVNLHLRVGGLRTPEEIDPVAALAAVADTDPLPFPQWRADRSVVRAAWLAISLQFGREGVNPRSALAEMEQLAAAVGDLKPHAEMIEIARLAAEHHRAAADGDLGAMAGLAPQMRALLTDAEPTSPMGTRARVMATMQEFMAVVARGDAPGAVALLDRLAAMRQEMGDDPLAAQLDQTIAACRPLLSMVPGGDTAPLGQPTAATFDGLAPLRSAAEQPGLHPTERALRLCQLGTTELAIDGAHLDDAVEHLRGAVAAAPDQDARLVQYLMTFGSALVRRREVRGSRRDGMEAVGVLERARELAGGPEHNDWTTIGIVLGHALRLADRRPSGDQIGLDGLRGHAWKVFLQSSTADAVVAARHAGTEAVDVARWFLEDRDAAGAAQALDTGRGLVLRSAVQFGDVVARLRARGEHDLARRWQAAVGTGPAENAPPGLRREIVACLGTRGDRKGTRADALAPPEPAEVRAALARLDLDALVYLVPGEQRGGAAVILPAADEPDWLPLPRLSLGDGADLADWLAQDAGRGLRDIDPAGPGASAWEKSLARVCRWAWDTAMGPLLGAVRRPDGRPPRVALVPMGPLARVPWHAAHDGLRYAVQRAAVSYAPSARMLCDAAWASDVPFDAGLVIGDPDTGHAGADLPAARAEALAIRDAYYPRARYVGRDRRGGPAGEGAGSRDDVARWLAEGSGTVLHAACHGRSHDGTEASHLLLAGGSRLTADELIQAVTARPGRGLALAVLAACSTGVPGKEYDEAFSLGTAFLTAGARTVVSASWKVPDDATSVLMFLFHDLLRTHRPLDALCAAQRWMLDPERRVPESMPPSLRERVATGDPADIAAWAGFSHSGR